MSGKHALMVFVAGALIFWIVLTFAECQEVGAQGPTVMECEDVRCAIHAFRERYDLVPYQVPTIRAGTCNGHGGYAMPGGDGRAPYICIYGDERHPNFGNLNFGMVLLHEMFHHIQFNSGLLFGTCPTWIVEGSAEIALFGLGIGLGAHPLYTGYAFMVLRDAGGDVDRAISFWGYATRYRNHHRADCTERWEAYFGVRRPSLWEIDLP